MSDADRRPTKAQRKEQARLEREEIQQRMARRQRTRTIGTALVVVAIVAGAVAFFAFSGDDGPSGDLAGPTQLLARAEQAAEAAACDDVQTVAPYDGANDQTHVGDAAFPTMPDLSTYPSTPPASGPHETTTLPSGVYDSPPPMGPLIHSLEHGGSVVWYDPAAPQAEIDRIVEFYEQDTDDVPAGQDRVIVAPYDYEAQGGAGQLPAGTQMALVAWHRVQTCGEPSLEVALDFTSRFSAPASLDREYAGEAPEAGFPM
ncbi:MAG TPA: DUF3105 domain-containing protein [Actinomycetota bacterium]|nr:DUF3105 domain-containing protein [Actinomycetota bacterium]